MKLHHVRPTDTMFLEYTRTITRASKGFSSLTYAYLCHRRMPAQYVGIPRQDLTLHTLVPPQPAGLSSVIATLPRAQIP